MGKGALAPPPWRAALVPREGWKPIGLPFGPSLGVQMLQIFQHEGAKSLLIT